MKKIFGFGSKKGESSLVTSISPRKDSVGVGQGDSKSVNTQPGYHIRDKDLGKIHKAASVGNVARVQQILLLGKNGLNDRDKRNRTALHLACANGYPEVVTLLVERKCQLNLCDSKHRTALMKAVQCQEAECATILLEHGADPNLTDINGNTALHYAACGHNVSIAAKLLSHNANIGARNKDNLTPLLLAKSENKEQMVEFLVKQEANIHAVDNIKSHRQMISDCTEKSTKNTYQNNNPVDESSDEDSLSRLSNKPDIDDSWPTSDDEHFDFTIKDAPKPNLAKLMTAFQQSRKNIQEKPSILRPENRTLFEDCDFDSEDEDVVETLPKPSFKVQGFSHSAFPSPDPPLKCSLNFSAVSGATDEGATWAAVEKRENVDIESAAREQRNNDNFNNLSYVDRVDKNNRSDMMSALGLGEEEDEESSWDSESVSERLPQKYAGHLSVVTDKKEESTFSQQIEDVLYVPSWMSGSRSVNMDKIEDTRNVGIPVAYMESPEKYSLLKPSVEMKDSAPGKATRLKNMQTSKSAELDIKITLEEEQERLDESESNQSQVDGKETKLKSSELEVSENLCDPAAANGTDALIQQGKDGKMHTQQFPFKENEDSDSDPAVYMKNIKKHESKNYTSTDSVMTPVLQEAPSLTGVLQASDDTSRSETGQEEGRPVNKTSDEKSKVLMQINPMDDPEDLSQSSEAAFKYKSSRLLIEQLGMNYKDSVSLLKIQDAILSYERLVELKKNQCELLTGKIKKMESKVSALQKELSETKEMKSQLEYQKVEWKGEVCSLRFTLKQEEEKRRNADMLCEKITEQLRRLEEQYSKEMEMKQQLEFSLRALDTELRTVRSNLNQVVEERNDAQRQLSQEQNARMLQDEILTNQLCKQKELEMAQKKMMQNSEVSSSDRKEEDLLHKNHMLQDEIARLILERDLLKNQNQEKEKKYSDDIEIIKEKNDDLQKTLKQNEESLTKTVLQYSGQIDVLTAENTILKSKLESEKQNNERLETEAESYRSRLAAAIHDHDKSQTSKRDLELAFQRERDKCLRLQDKMSFDLSNLKDNNETLSQELSKAENKFNSLEIELHHTKDALREKTLVLESVQRELSQTQCQMKEIEYMYQNEEGKVNKYIAKQESIEERLSQLQSENTLLRQQLDDAHNKADSKEKAVMNIQDQFHDIVKKLQVESEKQSLMLEERNKELLDECNHLKERVYQYENEKAEREAVVRQLQQELADTLKKQSMSEASLEVTSRYRINLEDEIQDLKKKLHQIRCRLEEAQDGHTEAIRCAEKTQEHLEKVEIENAELKVTVKKQTEKIEQFQKNLLGTCLSEDEKEQLKKLTELKQSLEYRLDQEMKRNGELEKEIIGFKRLLKMTQKKITEYENGELSFRGDLKTNQIEMDIQVAMLKHKIEDLTAKLANSSSECLHLDAKNQALQQELTAMEPVQKKCEKLKKSKKLLKQEVVNLRSHLEINMIERSHMEQYKREIDERARQEVVEKLQEVNLFLQTQAASQEYLEQLRENNNASVRSQLELRIKDLESEISKMKTCQEDSRTELEKYKQLYLEELKVSKSLSNELNKTNEKLTEISAKLLMEKQKNRSSLSVLTTHIFQEPACVGDIHNSSVLNRSLVPRENLVIPTLRPRPSNNSIETYLSKVQQEFEKTITRELAEAAAECESGSCSASPVRSADSSQNQDLLLKASQEYVQILKKNYMI